MSCIGKWMQINDLYAAVCWIFHAYTHSRLYKPWSSLPSVIRNKSLYFACENECRLMTCNCFAGCSRPIHPLYINHNDIHHLCFEINRLFCWFSNFQFETKTFILFVKMNADELMTFNCFVGCSRPIYTHSRLYKPWSSLPSVIRNKSLYFACENECRLMTCICFAGCSRPIHPLYISHNDIHHLCFEINRLFCLFSNFQREIFTQVYFHW